MDYGTITGVYLPESESNSVTTPEIVAWKSQTNWPNNVQRMYTYNSASNCKLSELWP